MWGLSPEQQRREEEDKREALSRGELFVKAILTTPFETLPNRGPLVTLGGARAEDEECTVKVWRNIPGLYSGRTKNIVLRSTIDEPFWQSCIDRVDFVNPLSRYRVCAIGTSGTGTTFTTPLLIRLLLLKGSTVVYVRRYVYPQSWFYEFVPRQSFNNEHDGEIAVTVNVYPEESKWYDIPSLEDTSTYYVVDSGPPYDSCNPDEAFPARVIIVSSPDASKWGGEEFLQRRSGQAGTFRYYPLWKWTDVMQGWDYFPRGGHLSSQVLPERYRQLGGVPANLFADKDYCQDIVASQDCVAEEVESAEALRIVSGKLDVLGNLKCGYSKSYVIGIDVADDDLGTFAKRKAVPISTAIAEKLYSFHIQTLWDDMVQNEQHLIFESYLRTALSTVDGEITVPLLEQGTRTSKRLTDQPPSKIGGYSGIQNAPAGESLVKAAIENPTANILFYSPDPCNSHIDFVCKDNAGNILAFKATTSPTHTVEKTEIKALEDEVGDRGLMLYYVHPARSEKFTTMPATPKTRFCWIFHVEIPKPVPRERETW